MKGLVNLIERFVTTKIAANVGWFINCPKRLVEMLTLFLLVRQNNQRVD